MLTINSTNNTLRFFNRRDTNMRAYLLSLIALGLAFSSSAYADPSPVGQSLVTVPLSPGPATIMIQPSTNVRGAYVRTCSVQLITSTSATTSVITGTATPGSPAAPGVILTIAASSGISQDSLRYPVYLPPGFGLWGITNGTSGAVFCSLDLL